MEAGAALRTIARSEEVKAFILERPDLYRALFRAARRYLAGTNVDECLHVAGDLALKGIVTTIDAMGENSATRCDAERAFAEKCDLVSRIGAARVPSSVSFDLSHLGLSSDPDLCQVLASQLSAHARAHACELMINMEGSERTEDILAMYERLAEKTDSIGITLQAHLNRTDRDLERVLAARGRIRLVKGAYAEESSNAWARGPQLDLRYCRLVERILASGRPCSIATHDADVISRIRELLPPGNSRHAEFEMLYGVQPTQLNDLRRTGYSVRVFLAFGREWFLYLCHRLAEYPPSVLRAVADIVGGQGEIGNASPYA